VPNMSGNIIPNDQIGSMTGRNASGAGGGGGVSNVYSITVNAGVGDPRRIGEEVVSVISKFEQANGAVFARA